MPEPGLLLKPAARLADASVAGHTESDVADAVGAPIALAGMHGPRGVMPAPHVDYPVRIDGGQERGQFGFLSGGYQDVACPVGRAGQREPFAGLLQAWYHTTLAPGASIRAPQARWCLGSPVVGRHYRHQRAQEECSQRSALARPDAQQHGPGAGRDHAKPR